MGKIGRTQPTEDQDLSRFHRMLPAKTSRRPLDALSCDGSLPSME
jgi:hypothetical protein